MTKEELISAVEQLYGKDRFDFSLVPDEFIERTHRVTIICKIHNEKFNASLKELLNGYIGCKSCNTFGANYHMHKITQKYKTLSDLFLYCRHTYRTLKKLDLLEVYYPNDYHIKSYWNYETCRDVSKPFTRYTDFFLCYPDAFEEAYFNNWLESYIWLRDKTLNIGKETFWTFERVKRLVEKKQYKSFFQIQSDSYGANTAISRHPEWKDLLPIEKKEANKFIDKDMCYEIALLCKTLKEMRRIALVAAKRAIENGWIKDYVWFKEYEDLEDMLFYVYLYTDGIAAYVGITRDFRLRIRHKEHNAKKHGKIDSVKEYFNSKNEKIPEPIILEKDLNAEDALYYEKYYIEKYRKDGYIILNKAKTGVGTSSLGSGFPKNTKEYCESIAKKYSTLNDFYNNEPKIYDTAHQLGWLKDYTWLKRQRKYNGRHYWTYEEVKAEAEKYEYIGDFSRESSKAYDAALWNKWIDDFNWLKRRKKKPVDRKTLILTKEHCFKIAKQYKTIYDFSHSDSSYYRFARDNDYLNDYIWIKSIYLKWTKERCEQTAHKYTTLKEFETNCYGGYHVALNEGWLKQFDWLK